MKTCARWAVLFMAGGFFIGAAVRVSAAENAEKDAPQPAAPVETKAESPALFSVKVTGQGKPMILIPGLSCAGEVWEGTVAHFQDRYECHVMTLAGFGGQPAMKGPMLEKIRAGLVQYIRDKGLGRPVIVGHSLGAFMSLWMAATAPEQVGPVVALDGVPFFPGLMNPKATSETMKTMASSIKSMSAMQTKEQFNFSLRATLRGMVTGEEDYEKMARISLKSDRKAVSQALYELMTTDLRPLMAGVKSPVLLLGAAPVGNGDEQKKMAADNYRAQVAAIPDHEVVFAPKARHFVQLDEPDFFYAEVEAFLKAKGAEMAQ